jgi:hypothetical protein
MIEIQIPLWLVIVLIIVLAVALVWLFIAIKRFGDGTNDDSLTDDDYENQSK